ncbi:MAG: relaxase/mobilization nuclease domain-containing protein [Sphingobacterium sp.]|jgi:hypothetical protein|nr:relaxase/mobilization nuclease domain-containing protein [Sphingobacterium sp.]
MIAKIGHGANIYGALLYNHLKVDQNNAEILRLNNMIEGPDGKYTTGQLLSSFLPNLIANKKTEKTAIHISLNPDSQDNVSDEDFIKIAKDYMEKLGYGAQPYIVFKHADIDRTHIHIVSTTVDKNGNKISDSFEKKRSMEICRELENKYNLTPATEKQHTDNNMVFTPVAYKKGNIKSQIASVVRYLPQHYQFQTLGSYNALLSLFNITAEYIKKERNGEIKEGLIYCTLDENGNKVGNPFKASLFGKQAGLMTLRKHFEKSKNNSSEIKAGTIQVVAQAMHTTNNEKHFVEYLLKQGVNTVIRRNQQGRVYGITFIDHNSRNVFNGSQLGKQFSANILNEFFSKNDDKESRSTSQITENKQEPLIEPQSRNMIHPLFDFMLNTGISIGDFGLLESLLFDTLAEDPEEQVFEFNMKKKKKRKPR